MADIPQGAGQFSHQHNDILDLAPISIGLYLGLIPAFGNRVVVDHPQRAQVQKLPSLTWPSLGDLELPLNFTTAFLLQVQAHPLVVCTGVAIVPGIRTVVQQYCCRQWANHRAQGFQLFIAID